MATRPTDRYVIKLDGRPIGELQSYRIDDHPDYAAQVALIRAFLRDVAFPRYGVDLCVIGPSRSNVAAIRAYEKAGFRFLKTSSSLTRESRSTT